MRLVLWRDARTIVFHFKPVRAHPHRDLRARRPVVNGVVDQIAQGLVQQQVHAVHLALRHLQLQPQVIAQLVGTHQMLLRHPLGQRHHIHGLGAVHFAGVLDAGHGQQLFGQAHRVVGGLACGRHQGLRLLRLGVALRQCQLGFQGGQGRAQLVRRVVQKTFANIDQPSQSLQVAVERVDQRTQLAWQIGRLNGRKIVICFVRQLLAKRLQWPNPALHSQHHQQRSGQEQQTLAAQGVPQNMLNELLPRFHGFGHGDLDERLGRPRLFHDVGQLGQTHGLVQVHTIVKLNQGKVLDRRFVTHRGAGQRGIAGQPLPTDRGDLVKQARAGVVFKQIASRLEHIQLQAAIAPLQLFGQGAGRQVQRTVVGFVGRLHRIAIAHPGVHPDQAHQRPQDPTQQAPAQRGDRFESAGRHGALAQTACPAGRVSM